MKADGPQYRVRGTIGGDQVQYPGVTAAYTAHLETIRVLLNSIVSEHANIFTADIKDFYLGTPLDRKEYMRINLKHIPLYVQQRTILPTWCIMITSSWKLVRAFMACHRRENYPRTDSSLT